MAVDHDDDRRVAFERLRPLCSKLLEPGVGASAVLDPLRKLLEDLPSSGIRSCAEYISFPLLLLLDATVASRCQKGQGKSTGFVSDKVGEGVVSCLEILLERSPVTSSQQMAVLIRKLAAAAMLTPEQASEEFRDGVIKCLKAMFENLQYCGGTLCSCKARKEARSSRRQGNQADLLVPGGDCPIAALQSEDMSAAIGNLFFYLLQISHVEATRADAGSGTIRADALSTVRVLMKKVGTADALAFFLPGIASGLNKAIRNARVTQRSTASSLPRFYSVGAAGNSRSLEEAVRALAELLSLVLADDLNNSPHLVSSSVQTAVATLEVLQRLRQGASESSSEGLRREEHGDKSDMKVMRVERSERWLDGTASNVNTVLSAAFPALCTHTAAAVRLALADAAGTIALTCQQTLARSMPLLLETLLALAYDDSKSVTLAATKYLAMITARGTPFARDVLPDVINRLLRELPKAVLAEDERVALLHARRLAASMYLAGPSGVFQSLFQSPASTSRFVSIMTQCLTPAAIFTGSFSRSLSVHSLSISDLQHANEVVEADKLPRPPPWFDQAGKTKLYTLMALALRIAGFSSATGSSARTAITDILDSLQATLRDCAAHCSSCDFQNLTCRVLYESGKLRRDASTAVCALSEIIYGASGMWLDKDLQLFGEAEAIHDLHYQWTSKQRRALTPQLIDATGTVLHDYLELWDLPVCGEASDGFDSGSTKLHLPQDNATLQQVLVEAVGVCGIALGPSFLESGFIGLVIYPLLEKLGCSSYSISHAASISLQAICRHANYGSVRELVVSNSDYVVDALCRQLRHITVYPHAPELLAAILQQTGAAADLLPLLEEPTRAMLLELEIAGRRQHPHLTVPILKALREIAKAARQGSSDLVSSGLQLSGDKEKLLETLLERNRCQRAVLAVATSSIISSAPLVASQNPQACILALDIIEHGMAALSKIEAGYKHDKAQKQAVQSQLSSQQGLDENEDINEANKLLPTMHRIWPHLIAALRHSHPFVIVKCLHVVASVTEDCGGDFLARRFQKDAIPLMVKLLQDDGPVSPSRAEMSQIVSINQRQQNLGLIVSKDSMLKVREAVLECIRAVASSKASSTALKMVLETVVAKVIVIALSSNSNSRLKEAAMDTAVALSSVNSDLVWVMVADLAFESQQRRQRKVPAGFPSLDEIFPPLSSPRDALCLQYAGVSGSPQLDKTAALLLLARLEGQVDRPTS